MDINKDIYIYNAFFPSFIFVLEMIFIFREL